ncbi:MAG TPA: hypothetical protein ENN43_06995 [bacterium]|nr:hypothetical protein [bacterium]
MKKNLLPVAAAGLLLSLIIVVSYFFLFSTPNVIKPKAFGGEKYDSARAMVIDEKNNFILAGMTMSYGPGYVNPYWLKISPSGRLIKQQAYGGKGDDRILAITARRDSGYMMAGHTNSFGAGGQDVFLLRVDENGKQVAVKTFGGKETEEGRSIIQGNEGGYLICGASASFGPGNYSAYVIKTDSDGNCVWAKTYGGVNVSQAYFAAGTDGGYLIAGDTTDGNLGKRDMWLFKLDGQGVMLWEKFYGGIHSDTASCVFTEGENIMLAGDTGIGQGRYSDMYLAKLGPEGGIIWEKVYSMAGFQSLKSAAGSKDGGFILAGVTAEADGRGQTDIIIIKTDSSGDVLWTKTYGGSQDDFAAAVAETADGKIALAGWTNSMGAGDYDVYFFKAGSEGEF